MGTIYKIINDINTKVYIGKTIRPLKMRWKEHKTNLKRQDCPLYRAFQKYGIEHFSIEAIEENIPDDLINSREIFWINQYNSYKNGYNATPGGDGGRTHYLPENEQEKILKLWQIGNTFSEIKQITGVSYPAIKRSLIEKSTLKLDEIIQENELRKQKQKTIQQQLKKEKQEQDLKERRTLAQIRCNEKRIQRFSGSETFIQNSLDAHLSITYIAKQLNTSYETLYNYLAITRSPEILKTILSQNTLSKACCSNKYYQYSLDGKLIHIYENRYALLQDYSANQIKCIQNCARGVKRNMYGYKWFYTYQGDIIENS